LGAYAFAAMPPSQTICALCLRERKLRLSHIVPEFAYKPAYDDLHRMHAIPGHAPEEHAYLQKGLRDQLLCDECEGFVNDNFEKPFNKFWVEGDQLEKMRAAGRNVIDGIDYGSFKLFHLSVVWRASVCKNPAFSKVSLGPHEETIRKMLLAKDPGPAWLYPITCGVIINEENGKICHELMMSPMSFMVHGHRGVDISFCGCKWLYFISSHSMPEVRCFQLTEAGTIVVDPLNVGTVFRRYYAESRRMAGQHGPIDMRQAFAALAGRKLR
jgi:hypothetical protein